MKIGNTIYLDHQATTPIDPHILAEMVPYFSDSFGNPHSSEHYIGWEAARAVEHAAERIAQLINADPNEIIFTSGATESNNFALLGLVRRAAGGGSVAFLNGRVVSRSNRFLSIAQDLSSWIT